MGHAHVHVPHELAEPPEDDDRAAEGSTRGERVLELAAVLLLSLTTLATAWSGYEAARWSGEQSQHYARSSATRIKSQEQTSAAGQLRIDDLVNFDHWLDLRGRGQRRLAAIYVRRFRPEFLPAFHAWLAQRPFTNPHAVAGPLFMPQYRPVELQRAAALNAEADRLYADGTAAKSNDDHYILSTVFFAGVLFFAGISLRLQWRPLRIAVLCLGAVMLAGGVVFVSTLPVA